MLGNDIQSHTRAAASIFLERFTGLVCLLLMFGVALMFLPTAEGTAHSLLAYVGMATLAGCAGLLLVIYIPTVKTWGVGILSRIPWVKKLVPALDEVYQEVAALRYSPLLITTLLLSAIFYLLGSVSIFLASQAIGMQPVYFDVLLVTPIIYLVTLIPVSPNNIGWWEWSVGLLLQPAGLVISQGLAVGLLMRAVTMTVSLIGGVLFLDQRRKSTAHS